MAGAGISQMKGEHIQSDEFLKSDTSPRFFGAAPAGHVSQVNIFSLVNTHRIVEVASRYGFLYWGDVV